MTTPGPVSLRAGATSLQVAGLFAGIGGLERGLHQAGHHTELLCEIDPGAQAVLAQRFPGIPLVGDIRSLDNLPPVDLVAAGFPCQDLSQAGRTAGISGRQSGLVGEVFRLVRDPGASPKWLLLENVPFMLQLDRGEAMSHLVRMLEGLGFAWAYRVVDALAFGRPQRRRRVLLLASRTEDPRSVLLTQDAGAPRAPQPAARHAACGFYWTEGLRGLGWAFDAVPTLKGGSTIGIPSPPAIWVPEDEAIVTPDIRDAERLQGFPADWTIGAVDVPGVRPGHRWKLTGNAVSVPVARWVGRCLAAPSPYDGSCDEPLRTRTAWPTAAWGRPGEPSRQANLSMWPVRSRRQHLLDFLRHPTSPLSARATGGFLSRAQTGSLRMHPDFLADVATHLERMSSRAAVA